MFDSHCHLNFKAFNDDAHAMANAMANNHVDGLVVGCDSTTSRYAIDLAQTFPNLWASVGLHPTHVLDNPWDDALMKELALQDKVVAIGEVGLDFYRFPKNVDKTEYIEAQGIALRQAIALAKQLKMPLVIHSRNAYNQLIEVLENELSPVNNPNNLHGTVHCFMGNKDQAHRLLNLGFMLGFTGVITYADASLDLLGIAADIPLDRLLIETDAPYLTPEPYRTEGKKLSGKVPRNLPQYTLEVAKKIASLRQMKFMDIVQITDDNARRLLKIVPTQHSAGGLVFRQLNKSPDSIEICMVKDSYGHWTFPKGHIEQEETLQDAAEREISEETGIRPSSIVLIKRLGEVNYMYASTFARDGANEANPKKIHKYVTYYLFKLNGETNLVAQEGEIEAIKWVPLKNIAHVNEYEANVSIVREALRYLLPSHS